MRWWLGLLVLAASAVLFAVTRPPPVSRIPPGDRLGVAAPPAPAPRAATSAPETPPQPAGASVTGRVTFPNGAPVPGAYVAAAGLRGGARTDAAGRYVLHGVPSHGATIRCREARAVRDAPAGADGVDFVVRRSVLVVTLRDEDGRGVVGAGISAVGRGVSRLGGASWRTTFEPGIEVRIEAHAPGYAPVAEGPWQSGASPGYVERELVFRKAGHRLRVRVVHADGTPVRELVVELKRDDGVVAQSRKLTADADGGFQLTGLESGGYRLWVGPKANPVLGTTVDLEVPRRTLDVRLGATGRLCVIRPDEARVRLDGVPLIERLDREDGAELVAGRYEVIVYRKREELRRIRVVVEPGKTTVVEPGTFR